jgi:hypothetical protein
VASDLQREKQVRLDVAARFFEIEFSEWRIVRTGASEQHMIDGGGQFVEELGEALKVGGVEGYSGRRAEFARYFLKPLRIPRREHEVRPLGMG